MTDTRPPEPPAEVLEELGYRAALRPIWDDVSIHDGPAVFLEQLGRLTEAQGMLLAAHWCVSEVCNGGHFQLFYNATGVLAPEGARGLAYLGLPRGGEILLEAMSKFGRVYPRDQARRGPLLESLAGQGTRREEWDPFCALDRGFYQVAGTAAFGEQASRFVREHRGLFFREPAPD